MAIVGLVHSSWGALVELNICVTTFFILFFCVLLRSGNWDDLKDGLGWRAFQGATD